MEGACSPTRKQLLLALLVASFVFQTALVYTDARSEPLSAEAEAGRVLWHRYACQTCHQLYGQGGFLGPDLTNAASRVDSARLVSLLRVGSGQMPALGFTDQEAVEMAAFMEAMDRPEIGRGQLRMGTPAGEGIGGTGAQGAFDRAVAAALDPGTDAERGFEVYRSRPCSACHFPFRISPVGAADLSLVASSLEPEALATVLTDGRPQLGMPPPVPPLDDADRDALIAFMVFLEANRSELEAVAGSLGERQALDWSALPWWEYP